MAGSLKESKTKVLSSNLDGFCDRLNLLLQKNKPETILTRMLKKLLL